MQSINELNLIIANISIQMSLPISIEISEPFLPFVRAVSEPSVKVKWQRLDKLPKSTGKELYVGNAFDVFYEENKYVRYYHEHMLSEEVYAVAVVEAEKLTIRYLAGSEKYFSECGNSFYHIALEERLIDYDRFMLHASLIDTPYGGILFSGRSGIGKSTQANLWCRYREARQINGDRPILHKGEDGWMAYGSPYAGSSRVYINEGVPVRAIVMLEQAGTCTIDRLSTAQAFRRLYAGATVNSWNSVFMERICDLLENLAQKVPVYLLRCTPDVQAVELLKAVLHKGE